MVTQRPVLLRLPIRLPVHLVALFRRQSLPLPREALLALQLLLLRPLLFLPALLEVVVRFLGQCRARVEEWSHEDSGPGHSVGLYRAT